MTANAMLVTQMGDDVVFSYDESSPYGKGTVVGNSISFDPDNIRAESMGAGAVEVEAILAIDIWIKPGSSLVLDSIDTRELGDYTLF
ncbi:MAG: hypothetical protein EX270_08075, partial [Pseudomonadales bacterium]